MPPCQGVSISPQGGIASGGSSYAEDDGFVSTDALSVQAGAEGATLWRWELASPELPWAVRNARSKLRLASEVDLTIIADALLIRLDSVAFPPDGTAMLHVHQGPGIRCLKDGSIRIDTDGHSAYYGLGSPWFELGPEPVFAQGAMDRPSRFVRCSILPWALLGASSICGDHVGRLNALRAFSTAARVTQSSTWSLIRPIACMKAKTVVGPTNFQPRFFRSLERAMDSGEVEIV